MGVRILDGKDGTSCLYCSTTDWAFGPLFESAEQAEFFLQWLTRDARELTDREMEKAFSDFRASAKECRDCGDWFVVTESKLLCECCYAVKEAYEGERRSKP